MFKFLLQVYLSRVIFHLFYINNLLLLRKVLYYPNRILGHFDKFMGLIDVVHLSMCCFADCFHHFLKQNNTSLFIVLNLRSTLHGITFHQYVYTPVQNYKRGQHILESSFFQDHLQLLLAKRLSVNSQGSMVIRYLRHESKF